MVHSSLAAPICSGECPKESSFSVLLKGSLHSRKILCFFVMTFVLSCGLSNLAYACTDGACAQDAVVENGNVRFESIPDQNTMNIYADNFAAVSFQNFSIPEGAAVNVIQGNPDDHFLINVKGQEASVIAGRLSSTSILHLINPNGIYFTPTAIVNVNSLVASTLAIDMKNFREHNFVYERKQQAALAQILNEGTIRANRNVAMIAGAVSNQGVIIARAGSVNLASGNKTTVSFDAKGTINVVVNEKTTGKVIDLKTGKDVRDAVANKAGAVIEGANVAMSAETAEEVFANAVNQEGIVKATGMVEENGVIRIGASQDVAVSGTLDAGTEGKVEVVSEKSVTVDKPLATVGETKIEANEDVNVRADVSTEGDLAVLADRDNNGTGELTQEAGTTLYAKGEGSLSVDGSGTMTLAELKTDQGAIKVGTVRTPDAIAGDPVYTHTEGDIEITAKGEQGDTVRLATSRGDSLLYSKAGTVSLKAPQGAVRDLTPSPIAAYKALFEAKSFLIFSVAPETTFTKADGIYISSVSKGDGIVVTLAGETFGTVRYLETSAVTLQTQWDAITAPGVTIPGSSVKVIA